MITLAEAEKLGARHAVEPTVLSLYLAVPPDPAPLSLLAARADELIAAAQELIAAAEAVGGSGRLVDGSGRLVDGAGRLVDGAGRLVDGRDRDSVREKLALCGRDWPGRSVAIFACADIGLLEAFPLPGLLRERAVLGIRPHIRPLLAAQQHSPELALDEALATLPGVSVAIGWPACLAAVNGGAVQTLIVPEDGLVPGYECGRCGALSTDADSCPDWGTAALPVPDLIEEMVTRALEDGAQIWVIGGAQSPVAARLYSPAAAAA